jgi:hypothetical protein
MKIEKCPNCGKELKIGGLIDWVKHDCKVHSKYELTEKDLRRIIKELDESAKKRNYTWRLY